MKRPMIKMLIIISIFFTIIFGWYGARKILLMWFFAHYQPPAVTVTATTVKDTDWQPYLTAVGTFTAINGIDIVPETTGIVDQIQFHSGEKVKAGTPLVVLRHEVEEASLKSETARLRLAMINYQREKQLYQRKVTSQSQLDMRYAELQQAEGNVETIKARIKQKIITAPFDGQLGIKQVNLGQYVAPNTAMVTLQALDPLHIQFYLPEQSLIQIKPQQTIKVIVNTDHGDKQLTGKIVAINTKVDVSTRNGLVEALISNPDQSIYPGMYGLVQILLDKQPKTLIIPQTAISYHLSGDYVFVIQEHPSKTSDHSSLTAQRRYVKVGERRDDQVTIEAGLKLHDRIVTSGQLKLQNGSQVLIDDHTAL